VTPTVSMDVARASAAALVAGWRARRRLARGMLQRADSAPPVERFRIAKNVLRLVRSSAVDRTAIMSTMSTPSTSGDTGDTSRVPAETATSCMDGNRVSKQVLSLLSTEEAAVDALRSAGQHTARMLFLLSKDSTMDSEAGRAGVPAAIIETLRAAGEPRRRCGASHGRADSSTDPVVRALSWCSDGGAGAAQLPGLRFRFDRACVDSEGAVYLCGALKNATNHRANAKQAHQ